MFRFAALARYVSVLFLVVFLGGCGSSQPVIYPAQTQDNSVEQATRGGYDFLQSTKGQTTVTVSLRQASSSYVQAYVSITNQSGTSNVVDPTAIRVVAVNGSERTFSAYSPGEVPSIVQQSAQASSEFVHHMGGLTGTTTSEVAGEAQRGGSRGGYSGGSDDNSSYLDLMLQKRQLGDGAAAGGLVYTPFNRGFAQFRIEVPIGQTTHTFRFAVRREDE